MSRENKNRSAADKVLRILLPIVILAAVAFGIYQFLTGSLAGMIAMLGCAVLLGFTGAVRLRTVGARFDPFVENSKFKSGADTEHHPDDVTLNPWDQITENGEQTEKK